jgi:hypothetical protein
MHNALIATLRHIHEHGDRNALHNIVDQLKANKSDAGNLHRISVWLADLGGIKFDEDSKSPTYRSVNGWQGKEYIQANFERAKNTPWYEYKKPAIVKEAKIVDFVGINLDGELNKLINAAKSMKELEPTLDADKAAKVNLSVSEATLDALLDLIGIEAVLMNDDDIAMPLAANG